MRHWRKALQFPVVYVVSGGVLYLFADPSLVIADKHGVTRQRFQILRVINAKRLSGVCKQPVTRPAVLLACKEPVRFRKRTPAAARWKIGFIQAMLWPCIRMVYMRWHGIPARTIPPFFLHKADFTSGMAFGSAAHKVLAVAKEAFH